MQFQVPQFIEVEDKVFGPLTFRQFLYLAGGAGLSFLFYVYLPFILALPVIAVIVGFAAALTFYKYNGRDFIFFAESVFKYLITKKLYLWKKTELPITPTQKAPRVGEGLSANLELPRLSESKLKELSWSLDVKGDNSPPIEDNGL